MLSVLNVKFQISDVIELHKIYVCSYVMANIAEIGKTITWVTSLFDGCLTGDQPPYWIF